MENFESEYKYIDALERLLDYWSKEVSIPEEDINKIIDSRVSRLLKDFHQEMCNEFYKEREMQDLAQELSPQI